MKHSEKPNERLYESLASLGQVLANPTRLRMINLLSQSPRQVKELAELTGQSVPNTSIQLRMLREAHLIEAARTGREVTYRIAGRDVVKFWVQMRRLGESRVPEVKNWFAESEAPQDYYLSVSPKELRQKLKAGALELWDVRPAQEFRAGHIPGAQSYPVQDIEEAALLSAAKKPVLAYCRGPHCAMATQVVALLRAQGHDAWRLRDGVVEWNAAGLPVKTN